MFNSIFVSTATAKAITDSVADIVRAQNDAIKESFLDACGTYNIESIQGNYKEYFNVLDSNNNVLASVASHSNATCFIVVTVATCLNLI